MNTTLAKWGNSLGIRIPNAIAKELGVGPGASVRVFAQKGRIIVEPVLYDIESLVNGITPGNSHAAIDTGSPVGSESW